ncbi:hypothetical protein NE236_02125 [Actinoallomurus purpureus]|uniref:hypothetical protein n=1 Tax=Actinoallomurus purpureus TaxID=478114 RepID=UPI002093B5D0|nr:hypothetical protein [Actinoallomurus purpureus]MCO6003765.1 hypothetical protein [Actinoallomurus purpureus]
MSEKSAAAQATVSETHDLPCAERLRMQVLITENHDTSTPIPSTLRGRIAHAIHQCCGHSLLKCHRLANGWTALKAVDEFNAMCERNKLKRRGLTERSWRQWEAGDRPDRDYEDRLCRLFETGPVQLGFARDYSREENQSTLFAGTQVLSDPAKVLWHSTGDGLDGRVMYGLVAGRSEEEFIMAAARDSAQFGQKAERTNVGPHTLNQFEADIRRIVTTYPNRPVSPTFLEVLELRNRAFELIEGRQFPNQSRDLYLIAGTLCGILANASFDLGYLDAAETQARTAYLCAELAASNWLRVWIRGMQCLIAYWDDRFADAIDLASSVRDLTPESGSAAIRLACIEARAHARLQNAEGTDAALQRAEATRDEVRRDDEFGGMLAFPLAKQLLYVSTCSVWLADEHRYRGARERAAEAIALYEQAPSQERWLGELCLARLDLASARLGLDELDGAVEELRTVMSTAARRRTDSVRRRMRQVSFQLERPRFQTTALAQSVREEITQFCAASTTPTLPGGATS